MTYTKEVKEISHNATSLCKLKIKQFAYLPKNKKYEYEKEGARKENTKLFPN